MVHNGISNQATLNFRLNKVSSEKDLTMWKYSFTYAKERNKSQSNHLFLNARELYLGPETQVYAFVACAK